MPKLVLCLITLAFCHSSETVPWSYHAAMGIAMTERIMAAEEYNQADELKSRIYGGWYATLGEYPFMAGLVINLRYNQTSSCGASLINECRLLTAAHCWNDGYYKAISFDVVLGSILLTTGGTRINTANVSMHTKFKKKRHLNDIAIIVVPRVEFTDNIKPIALPFGSYLDMNFEGSLATAIGYGRYFAEIASNYSLMAVELTVTPHSQCLTAYNNSKRVSTSKICATGDIKGICNGDSGGPLIVTIDNNTILIGIAVSGIPGCLGGAPDMFTRVSSFMTWINGGM